MFPVFAYLSNIVVCDGPGAGGVWHIAALKFVAMTPVRFVYRAERGIIWFQYYDPLIGQDSCALFAPFASNVRRFVHHHRFSLFEIRCTFDSAFPFAKYLVSAEIGWTSASGVFL